MRTQLTAPVSGQLNPRVNVVDTLNSGEFTIFAPVDEAFAAVNPATIEKLKTDAQLLTTVLTYHAVPGRLTPDEIAGTHKTVQGAEVTVTRSGANPGRRRRGDLRRCANQERDGLPDRRGIHAADVKPLRSPVTSRSAWVPRVPNRPRSQRNCISVQKPSPVLSGRVRTVADGASA